MVQSSVDIVNEWDIVAARQIGRQMAKNLGFGIVDQARIATAISELARNIFIYAEKGTVSVKELHFTNRIGLIIIAKDQGPGIRDIAKVMEDGYSTSGGLGAGLPGVKRLMDQFSIESEVGKGTVIEIIKWLP